MTGIMSVASHLITIALLWVAVIVIVWLVKRGTLQELRMAGELRQRRKKINRNVSYINTAVTVVAVSIIVLIMLFLYNPTERSYEEMDKMGTIAPEVTEFTEDEIKASNKEVMERKSREKEQEAEKDNIEAMKEAEELFRKAQERAKQ